MLKKNSKKTLDIVATQTKQNVAEAYRQVHPDASVESSHVEASKLMAKPEAQLYLENHRQLAKETKIRILQTAKQKNKLNDVKWQTLADSVSEKVLDRTDGKAIQRSEPIYRMEYCDSAGSRAVRYNTKEELVKAFQEEVATQ